MQVFSISPFATGSVTWQEQPDQWNLTVVCKATYALVPGTSHLALEPEQINERDNHWDDDPAKSIYAPSDLAPFKPRPEILLVGSAYAPRGEAVRSLFVRLMVGDFEKSVEVFGPRTFGNDGVLQDGPRWTQMSLRYERAGGGGESWNPVGIDPDAVDAYGRRSLPNLQPPGLLSVELGQAVPAAGYGPIAARWDVRRAKLGALAAGWTDEGWNDSPLGVDFDGSYFQSAPLDQLVDELRADEKIILENLHPEHPRFSTNLAGVRPRARVEIEGLPPWELSLVADTLWIDTNRALVTLTWRGQLPLDGRDQPGRIFIGVEEPGGHVHWAEAPAAKPHTAAASLVAAPRHVAIEEDLSDEETHTDESEFGLTTHILPPYRPGTVPAPLPFNAGAAAAPPPVVANRPPPRPQRPPGDPDETVVFARPNARGSMPSWLEPPGQGPAPPPAAQPAPGRPLAPPPPVSQLLRSGEAAPTNVFAASNTAAAIDVSAAPPMAPPPVVPPRITPIGMPAVPAPPPPPPLAGGLGVRLPGTTIGQAAAMAVKPASAAPAPRSAAPSSPVEIERPRQTKTDPRVLATAAFLGAAEASNAAADGPVERAPRAEGNPDKQPAPASPPRTLIEIIWFSSDAASRLRAEPSWEELIGDKKGEPPPASGEYEAQGDGGDDELLDENGLPIERPAKRKEPEPPPKKPDKAVVAAVLSRGSPVFDVEGALVSAAGEDGVLEAKLIVIGGDLELPFDEVETLKVLASAAMPVASSDKKLKETLDLANEVQNTPLGSSPEVASSFSLRIREAWVKANRMLPPDYLDVHSRRVLLEQRKYQMRELADAQWIRALLHGVSGERPVPTYLPAELARKMPLFARFPARLIAEVVPQQDQSESHPVALRVVAIARQVSARVRR